MKRLGKLAIEIIGLQSARGRLVFFCIVTVIIFLLPYSLLGNLSIWQRIGLEWAPSIGLTRAYWLVLHLDFAAAWQKNPLIYAVLAIGLPLLGKDILSLRQYRRAISSGSSGVSEARSKPR